MKIQAGLTAVDALPRLPLAFHINQREEVIDLGETAGALMATTNMQMQTFVSPQSVEIVPIRPSRQARLGKAMDVTAGCTGTLRTQEHGHQPLVFENHQIDARYNGPLEVAPTICSRAGAGGNNLPFAVEQDVVGALTARDYKGADNIYAEQGKLVVEGPRLIRRLVPQECEALQGYPPHWTDLPGASDSARYRALGNSVAIPCVEFVLGGIAKWSTRQGQ